jgi:hypothetical protein
VQVRPHPSSTMPDDPDEHSHVHGAKISPIEVVERRATLRAMEETVGVRRFETGGQTANHNVHVTDGAGANLPRAPSTSKNFMDATAETRSHLARVTETEASATTNALDGRLKETRRG